jgi:hypothetical protein
VIGLCHFGGYSGEFKFGTLKRANRVAYGPEQLLQVNIKIIKKKGFFNDENFNT